MNENTTVKIEENILCSPYFCNLFAEGNELQYYCTFKGEWCDYDVKQRYFGPWHYHNSYKWRIKPKRNIHYYRVGLKTAGNTHPFSIYALSKENQKEVENVWNNACNSYFVKWLTDWVEYEVTEKDQNA